MKIAFILMFVFSVLLSYALFQAKSDYRALEKSARFDLAQKDLQMQNQKSLFDDQLDELYDYALLQDGEMPATIRDKIVENCENGENPEISRQKRQRIDKTLEKQFALLFANTHVSEAERIRIMDLLRQRQETVDMATASYYTSPEEIQQNLLERDALLKKIDDEIVQVLDEDDYYKYSLLKDSGFEQYQLKQFNLKIADTAPLDDYQSNQLLMSKLIHKQNFTQALEDVAELKVAGVDSGSEARQRIMQAVDDYSEALFKEMSEVLSEEQMASLMEFESQQFSEVRQSLMQGL